MKTASIRFQNVSKSFVYYQERNRSLKTSLVEFFRRGKTTTKKQTVQVLSDVTFEIESGDFVAFLGKNGAGKSTALKLISKIYEPNEGRVEVNGKIAPLIELGAGFDNELSGYENIFLNAAILGFSKLETIQNIEAIVQFSDLGEFIDMPVKGYSSGMLVRLGFAIATHLDAPILLIDEVLAVGDADFQQKCIKRILALRNSGKTIILVSHNIEHIRSFAKTGVLFQSGRMSKVGPIESVIDAYEQSLLS